MLASIYERYGQVAGGFAGTFGVALLSCVGCCLLCARPRLSLPGSSRVPAHVGFFFVARPCRKLALTDAVERDEPMPAGLVIEQVDYAVGVDRGHLGILVVLAFPVLELDEVADLVRTVGTRRARSSCSRNQSSSVRNLRTVSALNSLPAMTSTILSSVRNHSSTCRSARDGPAGSGSSPAGSSSGFASFVLRLRGCVRPLVWVGRVHGGHVAGCFAFGAHLPAEVGDMPVASAICRSLLVGSSFSSSSAQCCSPRT